MNVERRTALKSVGAISAAVGLLKHSNVVSADLNKSLFNSRYRMEVLFGITGKRGWTDNPDGRISILLPTVVENNTAIPVAVTSNIKNTTRITLFCAQLEFPLLADFTFSNGAQSYISTRFKVSSCSAVSIRAIVHTADGMVYSAVNETYVQIGDCNGGGG